jgi:NADH:ubiquinone oxidoreductase subunit C
MQKKYQMPMQLFLILEKTNPIIFTAETLIPSHYIVYINKNNFFALNSILKNEFFSSKSSLIEASAIDTLNYNSFNELTNSINLNRIMPFYIYYLYSLKMRLTVILNNNDASAIRSIDRLYKNAN